MNPDVKGITSNADVTRRTLTDLQQTGDRLNQEVQTIGKDVQAKIAGKILGLNNQLKEVKWNNWGKISEINNKINKLKKMQKNFTKIDSELKKVGKGDLLKINELFERFEGEVTSAIKEENLSLRNELGEELLKKFNAEIIEIKGFREAQQTVIKAIGNRVKKLRDARQLSEAQLDNINDIYKRAVGTRLQRGIFVPREELVSALLRIDDEVAKLERTKAISQYATDEYNKVTKELGRLDPLINQLPEKCKERLQEKMKGLEENILGFKKDFQFKWREKEQFLGLSEDQAKKILCEGIAVEEPSTREWKEKYQKATLALKILRKHVGSDDSRVKEYVKQILGCVGREMSTAKELQMIAVDIVNKYIELKPGETYSSTLRQMKEQFPELSEENARKFLYDVIDVEELGKEYEEIQEKVQKATSALDILKKHIGSVDPRVKEYEKQITKATTAKDFQRIADNIVKKYVELKPGETFNSILSRMDEKLTRIESTMLEPTMANEDLRKLRGLVEANLPEKCKARLSKKVEAAQQHINSFAQKFAKKEAGEEESGLQMASLSTRSKEDVEESRSSFATLYQGASTRGLGKVPEKAAIEFLSIVDDLQKEYDEILDKYEEAKKAVLLLRAQLSEGKPGVTQAEIDTYQKRIDRAATTAEDFQKIALEIEKAHPKIVS